MDASAGEAAAPAAAAAVPSSCGTRLEIIATAPAATRPMMANTAKFRSRGASEAAIQPPMIGPEMAPIRANLRAQPVAVARVAAG
ncbi:hypothetical protein [Arthrobacter gengyunqii]|uniref:hypothetical protein n=1 Tax=Arthrobacter gengyunqii TaxID=2886940 RepID=UPI003C30CBC5